VSLAGLIALVLASSICLLAQESEAVRPQVDQPEESSTSAAEDLLPGSPIPPVAAPEIVSQAGAGNQAVYAPLTLKQKWLYSMSEIFGPSRVAAYAAYAIYGNIFNFPKQWGRSGDSLAIRLAGNFGNSLIRHNVQFAMQALDHEDPRYFRSGQHGAWSRTKYAVVHTFAVRKDDGSWMPAYSLLATDYGMPYIVRQWRPERFHTMDGIQIGTLGIGISMGSNIFNEFWPDLKKKLPKRLFSRSPDPMHGWW